MQTKTATAAPTTDVKFSQRQVPWMKLGALVEHAVTAQEAARDVLSRVEDYVPKYLENVEMLADHYVTSEQAESILTRVFPDRPRRATTIEHVLNSWNNSPTIGYPNSGWGLVNAVSEYFEWDRQGGSPESRFVGALQGASHHAINRTASLLLSQV